VIYDEEVLSGLLPTYDWLHLHHEDFTGQYGKFWANYRNYAWYKEDVRVNEEMAHKLGFQKVSDLKLAVAKKIRDFVLGGGYLFAMCSATDSYDVHLMQHRIGDPPTDLNLYPNSAGYRLILNNILFPAAKKKKRKT